MKKISPILIGHFQSLLNVKVPRPFGQNQSSLYGCSDDKDGVQWNMIVDADTNVVHLGINLEGKKYGKLNWPILKLI